GQLILYLYLSSSDVARFFQAAAKRVLESCLRVGRATAEVADDRLISLLRVRRERPRGRAAKQRDEITSFHSITSSRRPRSGNGTSNPSALAVLRLITRWTAVACITGRSAGLTPLRIRLA